MAQRVRRLICRIRGHAPTIPVRGHLTTRQPAIADVCPRCRVIVGIRAATRAERRRVQLGRA